MHLFLSPYNENTVISKEYTGPLDFDITGVDLIFHCMSNFSLFGKILEVPQRA